ncbi:SDR family NAD(P)-dependent oxidoreductase [Rhodococcus opacus]|uniref:SDR family NAD(P)-dependent oxidoreductase n=1 Tax=Rhodococcus opacus TaxID=37919 RepID=UPI00146AE226|nr:SDR family NAD(P)-dependent oxidoreductase [Rhodococcus opacus]MDV7088950.1 SDR family NAD(P)-dependent oxidoreductase [Rhodococcus opacus]WKN60236.1 SDR family NAD(P)-dependent oxidoreductase [Rhodococcus opacus]
MGRIDSEIAFVTGAARGQGRAHAIRLAEGGTEIAIEVCEDQLDTPYLGATEVDLEPTVKPLEALGRWIVATRADVRDFDALKAAVDNAVADLGRLDQYRRRQRWEPVESLPGALRQKGSAWW